jgi:hypothetical protein
MAYLIHLLSPVDIKVADFANLLGADPDDAFQYYVQDNTDEVPTTDTEEAATVSDGFPDTVL